MVKKKSKNEGMKDKVIVGLLIVFSLILIGGGICIAKVTQRSYEEERYLAVFEDLAKSYIDELDFSSNRTAYKELVEYGVSEEDGAPYLQFRYCYTGYKELREGEEFADTSDKDCRYTEEGRLDEESLHYAKVFFWQDENDPKQWSHAFNYEP